jgi:putative hydrolase of the HAD superfamily
VSSDLGLRKPEPAAYRRVAELVGLPPSKILFLDDGEVNVVGARDAGMAAAHVKSVSDIREALMAVGVSV